jgi:2-polyprenyl-6-methoxyphenol hydroxylase-like FAD-dependent oxidoreductase
VQLTAFASQRPSLTVSKEAISDEDMTRHQEAVNAAHFEQRRAREAVHSDEGKRRKMIRWIKKTMGMAEDPREVHRTLMPSLHSRTSLSHSDGVSSARRLSHDSSGSGSGGRAHEHEKDDVPVHAKPSKTSSFCSVTTSSSTSTLSSSDASSVSTAGPSIYEYHHRMPAHRKPRADPHGRPQVPRPHVLIIGGGLGGLCLAQGLKKNGIPFTVFERDPTPNYRTQGYRLRINSSGYEALKANLSRSNFEVFLRSTGHFLPGFMYVDAESGGAAPDGVKFAHRSSVTQHVFSTDRAMLRSLLLTDLAEGSEIQFGMAFKKYEILPSGCIQVQFDNGRCVEGSALVGADGTTSRVRRQYVPRHITLLDTDSGAIYGKTPITPQIEQYFATACTTMVTSQHPQMSVVIEPRCGSTHHMRDYISSNGGHSNPANAELPELQNYLCWVLLARADLFHVRDNMTVQDLYAMAPDEVAGLSMHMTRTWCPRVRTLFEQQDPEWASFLRISTMSPDIKAWQPSRVTLLGDAVHTMTPAGIGCNTAMQDARILTKLFCEYGVSVDAIAQYERAMRDHGREGITISLDASRRMFGVPYVQEMRKVVY